MRKLFLHLKGDRYITREVKKSMLDMIVAGSFWNIDH